MSASFVFWFLMFLVLLAMLGPLIGVGWAWLPRLSEGLLFILLSLLGWKVFGRPIQ